jgi:hypothetical protein
METQLEGANRWTSASAPDDNAALTGLISDDQCVSLGSHGHSSYRVEPVLIFSDLAAIPFSQELEKQAG